MARAGLLPAALMEASCVGDAPAVLQLIVNGVDINARNKMNGWTALHWAAARNNRRIVEILLKNGADPDIENNKGLKPVDVTEDYEISGMLGGLPIVKKKRVELPITPSYLLYPSLPICGNYKDITLNDQCISSYTCRNHNEKVVLKARVANTQDPDFIEIELDEKKMNMKDLTKIFCEELKVEESQIKKIRKLPNTIVQKDEDVKRLTNYQEIEIIV